MITINKIFSFLNKKQKFNIILLTVGMVISAGFEMIGLGSIPVFINLLLNPESLKNFITNDKIVEILLSDDFLKRTIIGASILCVIFVVKNVFYFLLMFFHGKIFKDIVVYNSKKLYNIYIKSPFIFHINRNPAILVRNLLGEVISARNYIEGITSILRESFIVLVILILLLLFDPVTLSLVLFGLGLVCALFYFFIKNNVKRISEKSLVIRGSQIKNVNEVFETMKETKILGLEKYFTSEFASQTSKVEQFNFVLVMIQKLPRIFLEIIVIMIILLVVSIYIFNGYTFMELIPMISLLVVSSVRLIPPFNLITSTLTRLKAQSVSFNYIFSEYEKFEDKIENRKLNQTKSNNFFKEKISLNNVDFSYSNKSKKVLDNFSMEIKKGQIVGIIGISGSGKTTLIDLTLGLLKISNGEILIDGKNIYANLENWQSLIGYIPQDIYLTDDTILKNIAFGIEDKFLDKSKVESALKAAQISDFVKSLPNGLNTIVGNRGIKLSGGQRQRIGIARALYRNPKILILDEATSSLDIETEANFMNNVYGLRDTKTIIIATHRLHTLKKCDKVFLLDNGKIKQTGNISEILNSNQFLKEYFNNIDK